MEDIGYWVHNYDELPPKEILLLFCLIHLSVLFFIYMSYFFMKKRITRSLSGPSEYAKAKVPEIMNKSLYLVMISLFLIEGSILISHLSGLLFYEKHSYFMVGASDPFMILGYYLFPLGMLNLIEEVISDEQRKRFRYQRKVLFFYFSNFVFFNLAIILEIDLFGTIVNIFSAIAIILTFYIIYHTLSLPVPSNNPVLALRVQILRSPLILLLLSLILYIPFQPSGPPETWGTRTNNVELYFLLNEFFVMTFTSLIYLGITLPRWFRRIANLDKMIFLSYRDYRFDYFWEEMEHIIEESDISTHETISNPNHEIIIVYSDEISHDVARELATLFQAEDISVSSIFKEEYVRRYKLPNSDLFVISTTENQNISYFIHYLWRNYQIKVALDDNIIINNHYKFEDENYKFAFFAMIPSIWNIRRKLFLILCNPELDEVMINFMSRYYEYYNNLEGRRAILSILSFPLTDEKKIQPLPSAFDDLNIPDQDYIRIL